MKQNNSKYSKEEDQKDINSEAPPMSNREYKKRIANARSRYMQDYKETNKKSKYMEEKYFNNLLNNYYEDYNKLKNKYNLKEPDDLENNDIELDDKDYQIKKENINQIFSSDLFDVQDFNFDFCDKLIEDIPKENNYTLLKTTQNKEDYEIRLKGFNQNKKCDTLKEEKEDEDKDKVNIIEKDSKIINNIENNNNEININNNNTSENNINNIARDGNEEIESIVFLEHDDQFKENNDNYLILNQQIIDEDLPLFSDIISSNYNKNYRAPLYEHNEEEITLKKSQEDKYTDFEKVEEVKENKDEQGDNLVLINENKEFFKFEDIIKNDFNGNYKIPEYKIQKSIQKQIKIEQKNEENKTIINKEKKDNNINGNNNDNSNLLVTKDKTNNQKESGAFIENDENKDEKEKEIKNEDAENNINDYEGDEQFEKIDVDKLKEIDKSNDEDIKYNDFEENK